MKPKHKTLGPVENSPFSPDLKIRRRMPGWRPDEIDHKGGGPPDCDETDPDPHGRDPEMLFPEEALLCSTTKKLVPFQPGLNGTIEDAKKWVFGMEGFVPEAGNKFDGRLAELLALFTAYNLALYDLRWHHLDKSGNTGTGENLEPISGHEANPTKAESNWCMAVKNLCCYLDHGEGKSMLLDVVEVNKYVVSVRVVEQDHLLPAGTTRILEIGGSSSSHLFIPFKR